ncbi:Flp pilus assembly protein CpaB [Massilia violaceinigra]|uniref:Flp pilus assembly protein CpaB n=1 Tax=Massilia violaceinigra TaxID=2045208 RepID=A0A2D2DFY7_9BURK|nr:Flp pilus assembly protein CpaB [Massilia violaceinigra]ATQ73901.1 Flp pilus assembly protein CpaB [Massilia violaceinigra]
MKNLKALGLIVFALVIGLAAAVYAAGWVSRQGGVSLNKVVVAAVDIEPGSKINPEMLSNLDWPAGATPPGAFKNAVELQDRIAKVGILRGEPLLDGKLAPQGTKGGLSAVIAEGKRAMTVRVNDVVGVAGFALPGNYVDVMVNAQQEKSGNEEGKQISKTVLERVLVLAVAQEAGRDDTKPKVVSAVTLELSLEDSEKLDLARSVGTLSLVLRNQIDQKTVATAGITKDELFGGKKAPAPVPAPAAVRKPRPAMSAAAPAASRRHCVEVIQHGVLAVNCF